MLTGQKRIKKLCRRCGKPQELKAFGDSRNGCKYGKVSQCTPCRKKLRKAHYQKHRTEILRRHAASYLIRKYGITNEEAAKVFRKQGRRCAICRKKTPRQNGIWCNDHNHKTKKYRGIICRPCNMMLGLMEDNPKWLRRAADYLEEHQ